MKLIERIAEKAIYTGAVKESDKDIFIFSLTNLSFTCLTWGTLLLLGIVFQKITGVLVFMLFYIPLRKFAGGLHKSSRSKCYRTSWIIFIALISGSYLFFYLLRISRMSTIIFCVILLLFSLYIVIRYAPLQEDNNPISENEELVFRKIAISIEITELLFVIAIFLLTGISETLYFSLAANFTVALLMSLKVFDNKIAS